MLFHSSTLYSKGNITLDSLISHMVRIRIMGMLSRTIIGFVPKDSIEGKLFEEGRWELIIRKNT